jgi:hypothetical protein
MSKVKVHEPEDILAPVVGHELARQVIAMRDSKGRSKSFDAYRARITLAMFQRATDPKLAAWEYVNRAANKEQLTREYLRACVSYDPVEGIFRSRIPSAKRPEGERLVGTPGSHGYLSISVGGKSYLVHRLAWLYETGEWPEQIDHIDRDRQNNRFSNLRACTNQENNWNKVGAVGATWNGSRRKWVSKITHNGKSLTLGYFETMEEARARYLAEATKLRGHFVGEAA